MAMSDDAGTGTGETDVTLDDVLEGLRDAVCAATCIGLPKERLRELLDEVLEEELVA